MNSNIVNIKGAKHGRASTQRLVADLKETNSDLEFYPSTHQIIETVRKDVETEFFEKNPSVLDIGCGDGRVLKALTIGDRYGIEKAKALLNQLDRSIFVVGTDFYEQTLIDKQVDLIYCNPIYSKFEQWSEKIIRQGNADIVYLVIPERWERSKTIQLAIEDRNATTKVLGEFDFLDADRAARVNVHVVRVELRNKSRSRHGVKTNVDPFTLWFEEHFQNEIAQKGSSDHVKNMRSKDGLKSELENALIAGGTLIESLERLYLDEMKSLLDTYLAVCRIDGGILEELNVSMAGIEGALELKIANLKNLYWHELFSNYTPVTDKLTHGSRKAMLQNLTRHTHIDFTVGNATAVTRWMLKNADVYFDEQLIETYEKMISNTNIVNYVSNKRTWVDSDWRYCRFPKDLERISLELRCIVSFHQAVIQPLNSPGFVGGSNF